MNTRIEKFNKEMQRELGIIFQAKSMEWFEGALITVTEVQTSPDLGYVKAYLSIYNTKNSNQILELTKLYQKNIRKILAGKIKNAVRVIPELTFIEDNSLQNALKFDKIFENLRKEREERDINPNK